MHSKSFKLYAHLFDPLETTLICQSVDQLLYQSVEYTLSIDSIYRANDSITCSQFEYASGFDICHISTHLHFFLCMLKG